MLKSRPFTLEKLKTKPFRFEALCANEIETLRQWRIHPHNAFWFQINDTISTAEQVQWFKQLDPNKQRYYSYFVKEELIAFFHLKHINWTTKTAECGLITNPEIETGLGFTLPGSIALLSCAFEQLGLLELRAKVKITNTAAIAYNEALGFTREVNNQDKDFCWLCIHKMQYDTKRKQLELLCRHVG